MKYFIIIILLILAGFFIWIAMDSKKKNKEDGKKDRPPFRSEQDLEEYGKKMEDTEYNPVDFDDAE